MSNKIQAEENEYQFEVHIIGFCKLANFVSNFNRIELLNYVNGLDLDVNYYELQLSDASSKWRVHKTLGMFEQFDKLHHKLPKLLEDQHAPSYICDQLIGFVKQFKQAELREFLHFSDVQFPRKILNLYVYKRAGGRHKKQNCCQIYKPCNQNFKKRYITITKDGIQISKSQFGVTAKVRDMLLFDQSLTIQFENHFKITIRTHTRDLCIKANDVYDFIQILAVLYKLEEQYQNQQQNRFKSFAPVRSKNQVQMLVDGKEYYELLVKDIHGAQSEIFITDWWLSPELHLIRPQQKETRLDYLLQMKAQEGLKIYIIIFNEPTVALTLNSKHTLRVLSSLHNNIMIY